MNTTQFTSGEWNAICTSCSVEKNLSSFYLHSNGKPRKQCKECRNNSNVNWKSSNPEAYKTICMNGRERNREHYLAANRQWRKNNLAYDAFRAQTYRARKKKAVPSWANLEEIKQIYLNCPKGYHVDHIIPLRGKTVSGLHIETNLQYLTPLENFKKRNHYEHMV